MKTTLKSTDIARLAQIVREETGNQVQEKNFSMLESRIRSHILKLGIANMDLYWEYFQQNEEAQREAIQGLMTTHYTFFFREYAHFEALDEWIESSKDMLKSRFAKDGTPVKIWCAAASRGQEIYSLSMFLEMKLFKKHGVPFEVLGTDIDAESIAYAKNGVYPIREVNTIPKMFLDGFWKMGTGTVKDYAAVHPNLKKRTRFQTLNLLEAKTFSASEVFDVIFCRNVFIYFSAEDVKNIATNLASHLLPNGLFVSGMSEPLRFDGWNLECVGPSCYRKFDKQRPALTLAPTSSAPSTTVDHRPAISTTSVASAASQRYKVLCVDDSVTIQMLMKKIFSQDPQCASVDIAGNGREARAKLDAGTYDLITLDIHMPEVGGIEFLEKLYDKANHPPVLMVSSVNRTDLDLATKSIKLGAFDYVEKPAMNGLKKSADEIITKAKMAMRSGQKAQAPSENQFDVSIGQAIVVPDASQCLRVVLASESTLTSLEQVVKAQSKEYRSPALLIAWGEQTSSAKLEADILTWTDRPVVILRDAKQPLRANHIYIELFEQSTARLAQSTVKTISLQVLDLNMARAGLCPNATSTQVLLEETAKIDVASFERLSRLKVSDVTPATSFASLSCEFFANLRKAAA